MSRPFTPDGSKNLAGKQIRILREKDGISQEKLVAKLQLKGFRGERGVIKRIENGTQYISDIELKLFADFFHVSYEYLIEGEKTL
ncbi:MAG: helix-turn-helix transcriptional regulator [Clostridiales bacterium]|jgi:transcriptional regulator with XRE-family HTH domain|nr:helix-turn-helix transcriptional regulator [Clostridiales bacterium]